MQEKAASVYSRSARWLVQERHKTRFRTLYLTTHRLFTDHPRSLDESYVAHLWATLKLSSRFIFAALVILVHGLFPFLFVRTASNQIEKIYRKMKKRNTQD